MARLGLGEAEIGLENLGSLGKAREGQRGLGMGGSGGLARLGNDRLGVTWRLGETSGLGEGQHWEVVFHLSSRLFFRLPPARCVSVFAKCFEVLRSRELLRSAAKCCELVSLCFSVSVLRSTASWRVGEFGLL